MTPPSPLRPRPAPAGALASLRRVVPSLPLLDWRSVGSCLCALPLASYLCVRCWCCSHRLVACRVGRVAAWAVAPLWGACPCRAPAACRPAAPGGAPLGRGSRFARRIGCRFAPFFVGWRVVLRVAFAGVSPLAQACGVCPLPPRHECPPIV